MLRAGRWTSRALVVVLVAAAAIVGACGNDSQGRRLSATRASELRSTLTQVEQSVASGNCNDAAAQAQTLEQEAADLPKGVNSDLRRALRSSAQRLKTLIEQDCGATGTTGATAATGPTTPSGTTTGTTADGQAGNGKGQGGQKEKKPKKDKGKPDQVPPATPPADQQPSPDSGGSGETGGSGGD
jgi:hypothetical protein